MGKRIFRMLLKVLPSEFRGDYGREMEATFLAERREVSGPVGVARLWVSTIVDVFRAAPAEHLDILARDLRYAFRMLARRPMLACAATLTLALGIGANTAIFSVVNGVLLSPLPYPDAERIVVVQEDESDDEPGTTGYYSFDRLRAEQATFDGLAAMGGWSATLTGDGREAERVNGTRVTWEFFRTLGIAPTHGRDFERRDDHPERRRQVLLSDELWRRRYNGDPSVVGRPIRINGADYMVVGVMPAQLHELVSERLFADTQVWTLLGYAPELPQACRTCRHIQMIGRVKSGVSLEQAQADLTRIYRSLAREYPREYSEPSAAITPVRTFFLGPTREPLLILWGAVALLLLMTCANIANLLLIRASERAEEIAIRRSLGVTSARLLRQLITESMVLAMIGGAAGAMLARWGTSLIVAHGPASIPRLNEVALDGGVLLYAVAITMVTGVVFGAAPARMLITKTHGARATAGAATWRYRASLITVNVALSALLLVGSGLLIRSFVNLLTVEPGFRPTGILTFEIDLSGPRYAQPATVTQFFDELSDRLRSLTGVATVGASTLLPLTNSRDRWGVTIEGRPLSNPAEAPEADRYGITPDYFKAMNIPLLRGRLLTDADGAGAPPVVVISKTMAEELWPGENPIGRRITLAGGPNNPPRTIVGVVGDVRHYGLHMPATMQAYMPRAQSPWLETSMTMVVRLNEGVDPLSIAHAAREQVRAIDALQPVMKMRAYDAIVAESLSTRRFTLALLTIFAGTALILAIVGLYGALSFVVGQRHREIGVRVALGAATGTIRAMVLQQGMRPVVAGAAIGLASAAAAGQLLRSLLFGVPPGDALTFMAVLVVITVSAALACLVPAQRAAKIDPASALRAE